MEFTDIIRYIAGHFSDARKEAFADHPLATTIRSKWPASLRSLMPPGVVEKYVFDSSPGLGQWSHAPWLAVLSPEVTRTAMAGFYPVYLFEPGFKSICLVMGQGAQILRATLGRKAALTELAARADILRTAAAGWEAEGFSVGPFVTLKAVSAASADPKKDPWSVSVAFGKRYDVASLPSNSEMGQDLTRMLRIYGRMAGLPKLRFVEQDEDLSELKNDGELPPGSLDGAKRVIEHRKFEKRNRNRKLIAEVKKRFPAQCAACNFSFAEKYGEYMADFIEVHHKVPLSTLPDGGAVLKPTAEDFMVLCSNCHRAIHRAGCPDLESFRTSICGH